MLSDTVLYRAIYAWFLGSRLRFIRFSAFAVLHLLFAFAFAVLSAFSLLEIFLFFFFKGVFDGIEAATYGA